MKSLYMLFVIVLILLSTVSTAQDYSWEQKLNPGNYGLSGALGNPIDVDQNNTNRVFCGFGNRIFISRDRGETFSLWGAAIPGASRIKNIILHPADTTQMLVAIEGSPQQIVKTINNGQTWTVTGSFSFSYFGIPMTPDYNDGEIIYTMNGNNFVRSRDFGSTWEVLSTQTNPSFGSPCDIEVYHDYGNIILVGNNGGGIYKSIDSGYTWTHVYTTSGEIPTIAVDKQTPGVAYATKWGGSGGTVKTTDYGDTWQSVTHFGSRSMWGVDVNPERSNFILVGQYSGGVIDISVDGGISYQTTSIGGNNYGIYIVDSVTAFAAQSSGLYKLITPVVPVELISFNASIIDGYVSLAWVTATEVNNSGFSLERKFDSEEFSEIAFIEGYGTVTEQTNYNYLDKVLEPGSYSYRLKQIDFDGTFDYSNTIEITVGTPVGFLVEQNFPNPFNPTTTIKFSLPMESKVKVSLYNLLGEQVMEIYNGRLSSGVKEIKVNAGELSSGVYFYSVTANSVGGVEFNDVKKMTLLK